MSLRGPKAENINRGYNLIESGELPAPPVIITLALDGARTAQMIYDGRGVGVWAAIKTSGATFTLIFNSSDGPSLAFDTLKVIPCRFKKLFLTNTAQANKSITLVIFDDPCYLGALAPQ